MLLFSKLRRRQLSLLPTTTTTTMTTTTTATITTTASVFSYVIFLLGTHSQLQENKHKATFKRTKTKQTKKNAH